MALQRVIMGVAGVGKTTLGEALAARLDFAFIDGDALHPPANVAKMASGRPLDDADRAPWLAAIGNWLDDRAAEGRSAIVTCSALKRAYRDTLRGGRPDLAFIYLRADPQLVAARAAAREGHFWPAALTASQFNALEEPGPDEPVLVLDAREPVEALVVQAARVAGGAKGR